MFKKLIMMEVTPFILMRMEMNFMQLSTNIPYFVMDKFTLILASINENCIYVFNLDCCDERK
jgi:hypothetical protein